MAASVMDLVGANSLNSPSRVEVGDKGLNDHLVNALNDMPITTHGEVTLSKAANALQVTNCNST